MHGSRESVDALSGALVAARHPATVEIALCPSFVHLQRVIERCGESPVTVGAQDCSHVAAGAYTGEVSAEMLADLGCRWVLLGHSERRQYHAESDDLVAAKLSAAMDAGLQVVLCVGESQPEREDGEAFAVVARQVSGALQGQARLDGLVVAYEPVWAIGTGLTATPQQAQEMHAFIREQLLELGTVSADNTRLLYGGSVKGANAADLFTQPDIDGALVGGASLDSEEFARIIAAAA